MKLFFKFLFGSMCLMCLSLNAQENTYEKIGDYLQIGIPAVAGLSTLIGQEGNYQNTKTFVKIMASSSALALSMKAIFDKERPNGGRWAFPSGHTTAAFTGAFFIQEKYGWKYGVPACALASYVAWSRIQANKHDLQDIAGGVIVALFSTYLFEHELNHDMLSLKPINIQGGLGLRIAYRF